MPGRVHRLRRPAFEQMCPANAIFPRGFMWMRDSRGAHVLEEGQ